MASWEEFTEAAPELAARVQAAFDAHLHKLIATLRRDGSPRLTGIEVTFKWGELWLGMMLGSLKAADLDRDPRFALHSAPIDLELKTTGDARIAGLAVRETDPATVARFFGDVEEERGVDPGDAVLFRGDLREASVTTVEGDELVMDAWREGSPARQIRRR